MAMDVKDRTAKKHRTNRDAQQAPQSPQAPRTPRSIRTPRTPPLTFARYSVPHEKHPEQNEDTILIDRERGLAGVFDGVGSGPGRIASRLAARVVRRGWRQVLQEAELLSAETQLNIGEFLQFLMQDAHTQIRAVGERLASKSQQKIVYPGTTAVLAAFQKSGAQPGGYTLSYAHVGDSRIYLWRPNKPLTRLTVDDGYLSLKISEGLVSESDALRIDQATSPDQLSATERDYFERRNGITQALGSEKQLSMHTNSIQVLPGDRVLLCSDGIHDNLTDSELAELLRREARTVVARKIVQQAIECSQQESELAIRAKLDDMTAVVVTCNF